MPFARGIQEITSTGDTVTITDPDGPVTNLETSGGGGGLDQLTGDVTAGPGTGSQAATLVATSSVQKIIQENLGLPFFNPANPIYATAGPIGIGNATNDTTAMTNCAAAMVTAGGGRMVWPAGLFKINTWPTFTVFNASSIEQFPYAIEGQGKGITVFDSYANSQSTSVTQVSESSGESNFYTPSEFLKGLTINGTHATGTAVGCVFGDYSYLSFHDVEIQDFPNTGAYKIINNYQWTEGISYRSCVVNNCGYTWDFNVTATGYGSFDYWDVEEMYVNANANQSIIVDEVTGGAAIQHLGCHFRIVANCQNGATNTGAFMWLKGASTYNECDWDVHCEVDGGGAVNHTSFIMTGSISGGTGTMYFFGTFRTPTFSGGPYQLEMSGNIYIPGLYVGTGFTMAGPSPLSTYAYNGPSTQTITSGTPWVNTLGYDVVLYIPITLATTATLKFVQQNYNISGAGATLLTAPTAGTAFVFTVKVHTNEQIRLDISSGSIGTVQAYFG